MKVALLKYDDGMKIHFKYKGYSIIHTLEYSVDDPLWEVEVRELYSWEANEDLGDSLKQRRFVTDYTIIYGEDIEEMILGLKEAILLAEII